MRKTITASKARKAGQAGAKRWTDMFRIEMFGRELPAYWFLIFLVVFAVLMDFRLRLQIKDTAFQMLSELSDEGEGELRHSGYSLTGRIEANDLKLKLPDAGGESIGFGRVIVETPGPFWLMRKVLPNFMPEELKTARRLKKIAESMDIEAEEETYNDYPPTQRLSIRFEDVDWGESGMGAFFPEVDWIGPYSGALFEAAGCENDAWWARDEVRGLFAAPGAEGTIAIDFEVTSPDTFAQRIEFASGGNSSVKIEREFELQDTADDFLDIDSEAWRTTLARWTVEDQGFVRARNRACAREAKIDEAEFMRRHMASVRRILLAEGFIPDEALLQTYRTYAEKGGRLVWETRLPRGRALEDFSERSPAGALIAMNARVTVDGKLPATYLGRFVEPKAYPEGASLGSVVAMLRHEGGLPGPANAMASATTVTENAAPDVPAAAFPTPAPAGDVPSDPELWGAPVVTAAIATPPAKLTVRDLAKRVGKEVQLTLSNGRRYSGIVEQASSENVKLKVFRRGGSASLTFARANIAAVEALGGT